MRYHPNDEEYTSSDVFHRRFHLSPVGLASAQMLRCESRMLRCDSGIMVRINQAVNLI